MLTRIDAAKLLIPYKISLVSAIQFRTKFLEISKQGKSRNAQPVFSFLSVNDFSWPYELVVDVVNLSFDFSDRK